MPSLENALAAALPVLLRAARPKMGALRRRVMVAPGRNIVCSMILMGLDTKIVWRSRDKQTKERIKPTRLDEKRWYNRFSLA